MTDPSAAPPAPDPVRPDVKPGGPAAPDLKGSGASPSGLKPPPGRKPPPPPRPPSNIKKYLVLGIIFSTLILLGLIGWRSYAKLSRPPQVIRNVKVEWENAWNSARNANKEVFEKIESKVWIKGEDLTTEEFATLKSNLTVFEKTAEKYHELQELLRAQGKQNSQEAIDMGATQITLKAWIWDLNGVLDPAVKPPAYGGLYIPMYRAEKKREEASAKLREIREKAQEIIAKNDPAEIEATVAEVRKVRDRFAEARDEFLRLDEELVKGLAMPNLQESQLRELGELREYTSKANMGFKEAREAIALFPKPEEAKPDAPKPEAPKPEEPKPETPKPDPPKSDPPKEEPPKPDPPKPEPPKAEEPK